jgi:hypothetical protein
MSARPRECSTHVRVPQPNLRRNSFYGRFRRGKLLLFSRLVTLRAVTAGLAVRPKSALCGRDFSYPRYFAAQVTLSKTLILAVAILVGSCPGLGGQLHPASESLGMSRVVGLRLSLAVRFDPRHCVKPGFRVITLATIHMHPAQRLTMN